MTICSLEPETNVTPTNETCLAWVSPQRLLDRWQPEMFHPQYIELDRVISSWTDIARLGDLVSLVRKSDADAKDATWRVTSSGISRCFRHGSLENEFGATGTILPDKAILVMKTWLRAPLVLYWDTELYHGKGVADSHFLVLESRASQSVAWIQKALESEHGVLQLKRYAIGTVFSSISASDLLDIKIEVPSAAEQTQINRVVLDAAQQAVTSLRSRSLSKATMLVGRTHEDRLHEFEELLVRDAGISPDSLYRVEPRTRNPDSDLFFVQPMARTRSQERCKLTPQDVPQTNAYWRDWFWSGDRSRDHHVFNSFVVDTPLPTFLLLQMCPEIPHIVVEHRKPRLLPNFSTFRDAVISSLIEDVGVEDQMWAGDWLAIQEQFSTALRCDDILRDNAEVTQQHASTTFDFEFEAELFAWSRLVYRPVLALKVWHDDEVAGAYLVIGEDQLYCRESEFTRLDDLGAELSEILQPPSAHTEEVLRRESVRRLSDIMHRLNGPLHNANDALNDIQQFLDEKPEIGAMLVPNEEQARAMADMNRDASMVRYKLTARIADLASAMAQLSHISSQVKTLARIEERLKLTDFRLDELAAEIEGHLPAIRPAISFGPGTPCDTMIRADRDLIVVALTRVLDNSAREIQERRVVSPMIRVCFQTREDNVTIQVVDNALPNDEHLPPQVFDERVSKYFRSNKGSGFGLYSVQRVFQRHRGRVSLTENVDAKGERLPGVTFEATLQCFPLKESGDA